MKETVVLLIKLLRDKFVGFYLKYFPILESWMCMVPMIFEYQILIS